MDSLTKRNDGGAKFNKELDLKNEQTEMNSIVTEMKTKLEGIKSRKTEAEQISEVEDRVVEIITTEKNKEKRMKRNEDSLRDDCNIIKHTNI